jgi:transposase-like protein
MADYPNNALEFEQWFATEEACRNYLWQVRYPNGFVCPRCGGTKSWATGRGLYRCQDCDYQISVTAGTVFQGTRKPLRLWFRAMWYVVNQKHGVSALGLQRVLGLGSYRTAWTWMHKLRVAMVRPGRDRLSGTVEVDETYIGGKRSGDEGRRAEGKALVVVAVEEDGERVGRIRLCRVADASGESLVPAVQKAIAPGSTVRTDGWSGYGGLTGLGYVHDVVRASAQVGKNVLPLANRVISLLKRWLLGTHQGAVRPSHLDYYLDEFTFRFNRRTSRSRGKLFYRLVQQAAAVDPVLGRDIEGGHSNE